MDNEDFPLPSLKPNLQLFESGKAIDGSVRWTIHDPLLNKYFKIGISEFECLARFEKFQTAQQLVNEINAKTTLDIDLSDVKDLVTFLNVNSLIGFKSQTLMEPAHLKQQHFLKRIVKNYLYFTLPLLRPQSFLIKALPYVSWMMSKPFLYFMAGVLIFGLYLTVQRIDEFFHTFMGLFTPEGLLTSALCLFGVKAIHELSHAFVATKFGVPVPHMGVAFIVMYPVLYTEVTGGWRLESKYKRIGIGLAGIGAELCLAAIFLMVWHISNNEAVQSISFTIAVISMIGSVFVNLNPLMRFDGYYVLSDSVGIENLQDRSIALARIFIRSMLFGITEEHSEQEIPEHIRKRMVWYGIALIIYRFFLFLGIAIMVYHVFFKPLGLILMIIELAWFIGMPLWRELKVWFDKKAEILSRQRTYWVLGSLSAFLILFIIPSDTKVRLPAVVYANEYRSVFAPEDGYIKSFNLQNGQSVSKGDVLIQIESIKLEKQYALAKLALERLEIVKNKKISGLDLSSSRQYSDIDVRIEGAKAELADIQEQRSRLRVIAPFDGIIRDLTPNIHEGRYINIRDLLFRIVNLDQIRVVGYSHENDVMRLNIGNKGVFMPDYAAYQAMRLEIEYIVPTNASELSWPELASINGGSIPVQPVEERGQSLSLLNPYYPIRFKVTDLAPEFQEYEPFLMRGEVLVDAERRSAFVNFMQRTASIIVREIGLN